MGINKPFYVFTLMVLSACGNKHANKPTPVNVSDTIKITSPPENIRPDKINPAINEEDFNAGMLLVKKSDCFSCHKMNEKLIGPSFREIANHYPIKSVTIDTLADKVVGGGAGNWGQVPMLGHPGLSKEDAKKMMHYIFALKDQ